MIMSVVRDFALVEAPTQYELTAWEQRLIKILNRDSPQRNQLNDEVGSSITRRIKIDNFRSANMCGIHQRAHTSFRNRERLIVIISYLGTKWLQ